MSASCHLLQEVTVRLPGRVDTNDTTFTSSGELASALRRTAAAHGEHEKRTPGQKHDHWPDRYADYDSNGFMTLLSDGERPIGAYALGPEAGEWLQQATLAIRCRRQLAMWNDNRFLTLNFPGRSMGRMHQKR